MSAQRMAQIREACELLLLTDKYTIRLGCMEVLDLLDAAGRPPTSCLQCGAPLTPGQCTSCGTVVT